MADLPTATLMAADRSLPRRSGGRWAPARRAYRFFFGEDFFISYARADAAGYAAALANRLLDAGYTCFLDQWHPVVNPVVPPSILRALTHASTQVIVATPAAAVSEAVAQEVRLFAASGRPVVPIDVGGALAAAPWAPLTQGVARSVETPESLVRGVPNDAVVRRLIETFRFRRRAWRVRLSLGGFAAASILAGAAGMWQAQVAAGERLSALEAGAEALRQAEAARAAASAADGERRERERTVERLRREERIAADNAQLARAQAAEAEARGRLADSRALAITARTQPLAPDQRLLLAVQSWRLDPNEDARAALAQAVQDAGSLQRVLYSPAPTSTREVVGLGLTANARLVVAGYANGSLVAWPLGGVAPAVGVRWPAVLAARPAASSAALAPDGRWAAIGHVGGGVELVPWTGQGWGPSRTLVPAPAPAQLPNLPIFVSAMAFSPDGSRLAVGGSDGALRQFDLAASRASGVFGDRFDPVRESHRLGVLALAYSPDGRRLASSHGGAMVRVWHAVDQPLPAAVAVAASGDVSGLAFDATGTVLLMAAGREGRLQQVALSETGATPRPWPAAERPLGSWGKLARIAGSTEVLVQPLTAPLHKLPLEGTEPGRALGPAPRHDVSVLAAAAAAPVAAIGLPDGTVQVHALDRMAVSRWWVAEPGTRRVALDEDGARLFLVGQTAAAVELDSGGTLRQIEAPWERFRTEALAVEAGPRGVWVHRSDKGVWWCSETGCRVKQTPELGSDGSSTWQDSESKGAWRVEARGRVLLCSARRCLPVDGRIPAHARRYTLAERGEHWAAATDRLVWLCDRSRCREVPGLEPGSDGWIGALGFTPGGRELVVGTSEGVVRIVSVATGKDAVPPRAVVAGAITRIVFDRAGALMATGGRGGRVQLWDMTSLRPLGETSARPGIAQVQDLALAPAGHRLAVLYSSGQIEVRELDPAVLERRACAIANRTLTKDEWRSLGGGQSECPAVCAPKGTQCMAGGTRSTVHR
jgi:WD40 repeat protein